MPKNKLKRFAIVRTFKNFFEFPKEMKGNWHNFFANNNPIVLELACGKAEYTVGMAQMYPEKNFIGVDIKSNRIYIGSKFCNDNNITNAAFIRAQIEQIDEYFAENEVSEIWITFADPQLIISRAKKRLTHPRFLRLYQKILLPTGIINLKTDSPNLYYFTLFMREWCGVDIIFSTNDLYATKDRLPEWDIKTHYEKLNIANSKSIHLAKFTLPQQIKTNDNDLQDILHAHEKLNIKFDGAYKS